MEILDDYTVVVDSAAELASAVGTGNIYNYVYLGRDIQLTGGVSINPAKTALTIDGEYPAGQVHTLSDINSILADSTLGIKASSAISITMKNITLHGYNYFGLPYVTDSTFYNTQNVTVTYQNVTYQGPQIAYHPTGLVRFIDCDITITVTGTASMAQEMAEANRIELGGRIRVSHQSTNADSAVFWFRGNTATTSLTVLERADVEITSVNNYFMYSLDIFSVPTYVTYTVRQGASFILRTNRGISHNEAHRLASFTVEEGGSFSYVQATANSTHASLYINNGLTVASGASFYMQAAFAGAPPLINFAVTAARLTIDNPKSFVLYSGGGGVISIAASTITNFTLTGGQINYWNPATPLADDAGGLDDIPDYKWAKTDFSAFTLTGTAAPAATSVTGSTASEAELGNAFQLLQLHTARVLSVGDLTIREDPIVDDGRPITGRTQPEALVRVQYSIDGQAHTINGAADEAGAFSISTTGQQPPNIPALTAVTLWANLPFLIAYRVATSATGVLTLESVPQRIGFATPVMMLDGTAWFRRFFPQDDEPVLVLDTRVYSGEWELMALISADPHTAEGDTLPDSMFFRGPDGEVQPLGAEPIPVFRGGPNGGQPLETSVSWPAGQGIMMRAAGTIRLRAEYTTEVIWGVREVWD